jgi:hypothetical protein
MINIKTKKCQFVNCNKIPTYNYIGSKNALYCKTHASKDMIDIKSKRCNFEDCNKQPIYAYLDNKSIQYCASH